MQPVPGHMRAQLITTSFRPVTWLYSARIEEKSAAPNAGSRSNNQAASVVLAKNGARPIPDCAL